MKLGKFGVRCAASERGGEGLFMSSFCSTKRDGERGRGEGGCSGAESEAAAMKALRC